MKFAKPYLVPMLEEIKMNSKQTKTQGAKDRKKRQEAQPVQ